MNNEPKIGLVTVLYNGIEVLEGFFESLSKQTYKNYVLYVIDNSPNEDALNEAKRLAKELMIPAEFIYNNANLGVAKGNNQGIELSLNSGCKYVLLLNNDIEFPENTIYDMVQYAQEKNESIVVPKIFYAGTKNIWFGGGHFSWLTARGIHDHYKLIDAPIHNIKKYISYAPTCFMLISKKIFDEIGLFDEQYFVYYDDTDYAYRLLKKGYKIFYMPNISIQHKVSFSSGGENSEFSRYMNTKNKIIFIKKHFKGIEKKFLMMVFIITRIKYLTEVSNISIYYRAINDGFKLKL